MATRAPKEKRRNSEKRKEKSREAARCRRSKESEIFTDMAHLLPVPTSLSSQLDKASIMRLTIAFLKARSLLGNSVQELCSMWNEDKCTMADACWPQALGGILLALSSEGDIIYLTENVTQQLGLPQVDLIGQSIYDYCHPCDHDELREVLGLRADGDLTRSFFLRLKSTLTVKGRSSNLKAASYKVMNCSGRIVPASAYSGRSYSQERVFDETEEQLVLPTENLEVEVTAPAAGHFLVLVGDPIPHPSNIEMPLDSYTFLTKHSLDMKYTYVDEKIYEFLGYTCEDLEGHSAYQFHHAQDNDDILKSYKTMFTKGQIQTAPYRFLARHGGYAWVQTQATLVYGNRDSRPQAVVCVHTCLSEIEDGEQILFVSQAEASANTLVQRPLAAAPMPTRKIVSERPPQNMTSKLFVPKTADMDERFLFFDKVNGTTVSILKEEPEDLTHLAPVAGDTCIPLEMPSIDFFDADDFCPEMLDCLPLTGFELPMMSLSNEGMDGDDNAMDEQTEAECPIPPSAIKQDPFIFFNVDAARMSDSPMDAISPLHAGKSDDEDYEGVNPSFVEGTKLECPARESTICLSDEDEDLIRKAPFIPMNDEIPLFDPSELFSGLDLDCLPVLPVSKTDSLFRESDQQSVLVKLLQDSPVKPSQPMSEMSQSKVSCQAHKRSNNMGLADLSNPKRMKVPVMKIPSGGPFAARVAPVQPSRGATSSLFELLTEMPRGFSPVSLTKKQQSSSVLQNLLVSGHDLQTGHELQKRHSSCKAVSSSSSCFVSLLPSSLPSWEKGESSLRKQLMMQQESDGGGSRDSSSDTSSDTDSRKFRDQRAFSSLNTFPFDMDVSPGPSVPIDIDSGDFFGMLNLSNGFASTEGATE